MKKRIALFAALVVLLLLAAGYSPQPAAAAAIGDCNSSGRVSNNDIIVARNHLYDNDGSYPSICDANQDGALTAADLHCIRRLVQEEACEPANWNARAGTNLNAIVDFSPEYTFINAFKASREWISREYWGDPVLGWGPNQAEFLPLDANGYPIDFIPQSTCTTSKCWAATFLFKDIAGKFPAGTYTVSFEGEGTLILSSPGSTSASINGTAANGGSGTFTVSTATNSGIEINLWETDPNNTGDYIRNIQVIMPGYDLDDAASQIFHDDFLASVQPFKTLRYMDWMRTNFSTQSSRADDSVVVNLVDSDVGPESFATLVNGHVVNTSDPNDARAISARPTIDDARYSSDKGAPVAVMVELANQTNTDPWFNMPHLATDAYVIDFATYVRDNLDPSQRIYIEYSNEIWNGIFTQSWWMIDQGKAAFPTDPADNIIDQAKQLNFYGQRTEQVCEIWDTVFAADKDRVICVINMQASNTVGAPWLLQQVIDCPLSQQKPCSDHLDAVAIAPYIGNYLANQNTLILDWVNTSGTSGALDKLFAELLVGGEVANRTKSGVAEAIDSMDTYADLVETRGFDLVSYEGGQHLHSTNWTVNTLFLDASNDARMATVYDDYLSAWPEAGSVSGARGKMFLHFNNTSKYGASGAWGSQESYDDVSRPKLDALLAYNDAVNCNWSGCTSLGTVTSAELSLPNSADSTGTSAVPVSLNSKGYNLSEVAFALSYDASTLNFGSVSLAAGLSADFTLSTSQSDGLVRVSVYPNVDTAKPLPDGQIVIASFTQPGSAGEGVRFVLPQTGAGASRLPASCGSDFGQDIACQTSGVALSVSVPTAVTLHEGAASAPSVIWFAMVAVLMLSGVVFGRNRTLS